MLGYRNAPGSFSGGSRAEQWCELWEGACAQCWWCWGRAGLALRAENTVRKSPPVSHSPQAQLIKQLPAVPITPVLSPLFLSPLCCPLPAPDAPQPWQQDQICVWGQHRAPGSLGFLEMKKRRERTWGWDRSVPRRSPGAVWERKARTLQCEPCWHPGGLNSQIPPSKFQQ